MNFENIFDRHNKHEETYIKYLIMGAIMSLSLSVIYGAKFLVNFEPSKGFSVFFSFLIIIYFFVGLIMTIFASTQILIFCHSIFQYWNEKGGQTSSIQKFDSKTLLDKTLKSVVNKIICLSFSSFLILYLQGLILNSGITAENQNSKMGIFFGLIVLVPIAQFILQNIIISINYLLEISVGNFLYGMNRKEKYLDKKRKMKMHIKLFKKCAKMPTFILFSFVFIPAMVLIANIGYCLVFEKEILTIGLFLRTIIIPCAVYLLMIVSLFLMTYKDMVAKEEVNLIADKLMDDFLIDNDKELEVVKGKEIKVSVKNSKLINEKLTEIEIRLCKINPHQSIMGIETKHEYEKIVKVNLLDLIKTYQQIPFEEKGKIENKTAGSLDNIILKLDEIYEDVLYYYKLEHERVISKIKG